MNAAISHWPRKPRSEVWPSLKELWEPLQVLGRRVIEALILKAMVFPVVTYGCESWIMEKAREFQEGIYFCFIDYAKAFDCVDHNKLWKILKEMGIPDDLT